MDHISGDGGSCGGGGNDRRLGAIIVAIVIGLAMSPGIWSLVIKWIG